VSKCSSFGLPRTGRLPKVTGNPNQHLANFLKSIVVSGIGCFVQDAAIKVTGVADLDLTNCSSPEKNLWRPKRRPGIGRRFEPRAPMLIPRCSRLLPLTCPHSEDQEPSSVLRHLSVLGELAPARLERPILLPERRPQQLRRPDCRREPRACLCKERANSRDDEQLRTPASVARVKTKSLALGVLMLRCCSSGVSHPLLSCDRANNKLAGRY
jgi:hypothetical protein